MKNVFQFAKKPGYIALFVLVMGAVAWLYMGPLTIQDNYDAIAWIFAIAFPILVGLIVASQVYNIREVKTCPTSATSGGILGSVAGIITVGCPACPLVLLGWLGLGAGATGGVLGGPWIKLASLFVLVLALYWATKR